MSKTNGKPIETLKLYEIRRELEECLIMTEDAPHFDPERFRALKLAFEDKLEGCAMAIKNLEATEKAVRGHIKTLQAKAAALKNNAQGIRQYVKFHMEHTTTEKLNAGTHRFSIQRNSTPNVEVVDQGLVDPKYLKVDVKVDCKAIAEHFTETAEELPGTKITVGSHLRVS